LRLLGWLLGWLLGRLLGLPHLDLQRGRQLRLCSACLPWLQLGLLLLDLRRVRRQRR
jgi:hypothetical protein